MNQKSLRVLEFFKIRDMLLDYAVSNACKEKINKLEPKNDFELINRLLNETNEAFKILIKRGNPPLEGLSDIKSELKRCEIGAVLSQGSLLRIAKTMRVARKFKNFIKSDTQSEDSDHPILTNISNELKNFRDIEDKIFNAIISEDEISDNASPTLKKIRRQIQIKNDSIKNKLNSIISNKSKYLQENLITIRQDRYVVPVKSEYRSSFPGLIHDQSSTGATLFIEPMEIVNLNNDIKQLHLDEAKEIERILQELTSLIYDNILDIKNNYNRLIELDFIFSKGKLAKKMDGIKPEINKEGITDIKKGRHPLIDPKVVVPIDIYIGKDFNTLVVTGPNTGGKTITLKTIGLLTLMVQAGLFIPANNGTKIGIFDEVFADIGDEQSIEQSLSTFSSHMTNIVEILKRFTKNSLVLFDELGAGTDPTEGAALAISILDYLRKKDVRTVATTHYSELKIYAITTDKVENASVEFDVNTLSPTYRLLIGIPGKSNAFEISKRLGLDEFLIEDAKNLISKENVKFEDVLKNIEQDRIKAELNREETEKLKLEIEKLKYNLEEKKSKIDKLKQNILREAKEEAKRILKDAKYEADNIVKELRNISIEIEKEKNKRIEQAKSKLKAKIEDVSKDLNDEILVKTNSKPPKNLKIGDSVLVLNINQKGTVITKPDESGNLTVQIGIMKLNLNIKNLKKVKSEEESKSQISTKNIIKAKSSFTKTEIDLRGMTLDEAILEVDKYLDDAFIANIKRVTIIHGKGTGVLREGIHKFLKENKHVKGFRIGELNEGGSGATVVELK